MAGNYTEDEYNRLNGLYQTARANYLSHLSAYGRAMQFIGDDRLSYSDKTVADASKKAAAGDFTQAVTLMRAALDGIGYVATLPSIEEELKHSADDLFVKVESKAPYIIAGVIVAICGGVAVWYAVKK